jgi:hypothetical protein
MDQFTAQMINLELTKEEAKVIKEALWYFVDGVNPDGMCAYQYPIDREVAERMLTVLRKSCER